MASDTAADQREVADNIENFVPHEFVAKTQRFLAEHSLSAHDNRIFETAAFDQIFIHERLNIFVINKCSCRSDLAFKDCGRNFIDKNCVNRLFGPACVHEMRNLSSGSRTSRAPVFASTCITSRTLKNFRGSSCAVTPAFLMRST